MPRAGSRLIIRSGPEASRFWRRVQILDNGCWLWLGNLNDQGYGRFYFQSRDTRAHVWAFTHCVGPIPPGLQPDHTCRNRACVNPLHLELVTVRVNVLRGIGPTAINARKTHCIHGHPFSGANLILEPNGDRRCLICRRIKNARANRRYRLRLSSRRVY